MKRIVSFLLLSVLLISLFACDIQNEAESDNGTSFIDTTNRQTSKKISGGSDSSSTTNGATSIPSSTTTSFKPPISTTTSPIVTTAEQEEIIMMKSDVAPSERTQRSVPTIKDFIRSNDLKDLIFEETPSVDSFLSAYTGKTIVNESTLLDGFFYNGGNCATAEVVDAVGVPFTLARRINVYAKTANAYDCSITLGKTILSGKAEVGDTLVLTLYLRTVSSESENGKATVLAVCENASYQKILNSSLSASGEWQKRRFAFTYKNGYDSLNFPVAYGIQCFDVGGFSVVNYEKQFTPDDFPALSEYETLSKDAAWRTEALARIEEIRRGALTVSVVDENGNAVQGARVSLKMFESDFEWGTAVNAALTTSNARYAEHRSLVSKYCNAAVPTNAVKWKYYEKWKLADSLLPILQNEMGIDRVRGHCLVWDLTPSDAAPDVIPDRIYEIYDDEQAVRAAYIDHITEFIKKFGLKEWDVLNEATQNKVLQGKYGEELVTEWYAAARRADPSVELYYNDYVTNYRLFEQLDKMREMQVDYDGIGIQSHEYYAREMDTVTAFYDNLSAYGKRLKVTEYDFSCNNESLQAAYLRDMLIAAYACESMDGFIMWGYAGDIYPLFHADLTPKKGLAQWTDLIFNKWRTNVTAFTEAKGEVSTMAYYGSYRLSVTVDGTTEYFTFDFPTGQELTVTVTVSTETE